MTDHAPLSQQFESLDAYLAHLEARSAPVGYDKPYFKKIGPDRYLWIAMRPPRPGEKREFTRQELMEKFGFKK
ncbi:MAG: hypothetical protein AB7E80_15345 [Hyphomicrobiaceae bacterium]